MLESKIFFIKVRKTGPNIEEINAFWKKSVDKFGLRTMIVRKSIKVCYESSQASWTYVKTLNL